MAGTAIARHMRGFGFLAYVARRYWRDEALDLASSLAYTTLLSTVPLLAIGLALLAAFPDFETLRQDLLQALFRDLIPEVGGQVQAYVSRFAANAGRLTALGIAGLVATAVMLLVAIEAALNRIFRVPNLRAPWSRIAVYWAALTIGPLLAGLSLTMSTWFALLPWFRTMHHWAGREMTADARDLVAAITPFAVMFAAFTVLFLVAPNRRVKFIDALWGALVAALLLTGLRKGFALYIHYWGSYRSVYGALATVPIFLAWIYLSWTAVLFGAEIAAAIPELRRGRLEVGTLVPARRRLALALTSLSALAEDGKNGGRGLSIDALARVAREGEHVTAEVMRRLAAHNIVTRTKRNRFGAGDLEAAKLADLLRALELGLNPLEGQETSAILGRVDRLISAAARAEQAALQFSLRGLVELDRRQGGG